MSPARFRPSSRSRSVPSRNPRTVVVNAGFTRRVPADPDARAVADMFGLADLQRETLYDGLRVELAPGRVVAVTGPSGSGKSVLLRAVGRRVDNAVWLDVQALRRSPHTPLELLAGEPLAVRLGTLARAGLAEATVMVTPARHLSGGQQYRLALAVAMQQAQQSQGPALLLADEFASCLDAVTARVLSRHLSRWARRSGTAVLLATVRTDILADLAADRVLHKPLGAAHRHRRTRRKPLAPASWPVRRARIGDYRALARFHYIAGPPALHKRVYAIDPPRHLADAPAPAGVVVVSPPLMYCRGRNLATAGRYLQPDRKRGLARLNREIEAITRVIVHPCFRGLGLAGRLVRHVLDTAETPLVEALAAMGDVHPFFERAGMWAGPFVPGRGRGYRYFLALSARGADAFAHAADRDLIAQPQPSA